MPADIYGFAQILSSLCCYTPWRESHASIFKNWVIFSSSMLILFSKYMDIYLASLNWWPLRCSHVCGCISSIKSYEWHHWLKVSDHKHVCVYNLGIHQRSSFWKLDLNLYFISMVSSSSGSPRHPIAWWLFRSFASPVWLQRHWGKVAASSPTIFFTNKANTMITMSKGFREN